MRYFTLLLFLFVISVTISGQKVETFTSGNFQFSTTNGNWLVDLYNEYNSRGGFQIPFSAGKRSPKSIAHLNFISTGKLSDHHLWNYYGSLSNEFHGPLKHQGEYPDSYNTIFDTIWKVNRIELLRYLKDWSDEHIDEEHPTIFGWPGKGSDIKISGTIDLPDQDLAPFYDRNGNGEYEPLQGEYPSPNGMNLEGKAIPTFISWNIFNTGGEQYNKIEYHTTIYAYACQKNQVLNNSLYYNLKVWNKNTITFDSLLTGFLFDGELGCMDDDFWGTDTATESVYHYNQKRMVPPNCFVPYPEEYKVAQSITFLDQKLHASTDQEVNKLMTGQMPMILPQFHNMLNGYTVAGNPIPFGWGSVLEDSTTSTKYLFTDPPYDSSGWNYPNTFFHNSRKGPFVSTLTTDLNPNESIDINFALVFTMDSTGQYDDYTIVDQLLNESIPEAKQQFELNFPKSDCSYPTQLCEAGECIWPGDANNDQICFLDDFINTGWMVKEQEAGPARLYNNNLWEPNFGKEWGKHFQDTDLKHADASGDGNISVNDLNIIELNFLKTSPHYIPTLWKEPEPSEITLQVGDVVYDNYIDTPNFFHWIDLPVTIQSNSSGINNLHSICFSLEWEKEIFDPESSINRDLIHNSDFYNSEGRRAIAELYNNYLHLAVTDKRDTSFSGNIRIANFRIYLKHDLLTSSPDGILHTPVRIYNVRALNQDGNEIPLSMKDGSITIQDVGVTPTHSQEFTSEIDLFPNPVNETLNVRTDKSTFTSMVVYSLEGRQLSKMKLEGKNQFQYSTTHLSKGIYLLELNMANGEKRREKFIKL